MDIAHYLLLSMFCISLLKLYARSTSFGDIMWGKKLSEQVIITEATGISLIECVKKCKSLETCCSINYNRKLLLCQMNKGNHNSRQLQTESNFLYSDITTWEMNMVTNYYGKSCSYTNNCIKRNGICDVSGCEDPPHIENGTVRPGSLSIGSVRTYDCNPGYIADIHNIVCLTNGNWSSPVPVCREIASCLDIQSCNSGYEDGEYQIRPKSLGGQTVGLYCHGLNTSAPTEFLTLHSKNIAVFNFSKFGRNCGWNKIMYGVKIFKKVKMNIKDMLIVTTDNTFVDESNINNMSRKHMNLMEFGFGGDCSTFKIPAECGPKTNQFIVDLSGTGFTVDPLTKWKALGHKAGMYSITRSNDNLKVQGACGGRCGYCRTEHQKVWVKPSQKYDTFKTAKVPVCT